MAPWVMLTTYHGSVHFGIVFDANFQSVYNRRFSPLYIALHAVDVAMRGGGFFNI
jgi:hypothetical protein